MFSLIPANTFAVAVSDISGHWAQVTIQSWIDKGLIKGYPDGTFKPDQHVTRAEFMTLANRAFGYSAVVPITYTDVKAGSWYAPEVAKAKGAGYISGYPDGTMKPENPITREEVATIVARIKNLTSAANAADKYTDASSISSWSKGQVGAVTSAQIMQGYPAGSFMPQGLMTRAEVVVASDNTLQYTAPVANIAVRAITVTPTTMALTAGGATGAITATVSPSNATNKIVTWSSSNAAVATVAGGVVTPVAAGAAVITATTVQGSFTVTCTVTVTAPVVSEGPAPAPVPTTYTVTFDKNGGTTEASPASISTNYDTTVTLPTPPTRTGYAFAGWNTVALGGDTTTFDASTHVTANVTVYAQWTINQYTLTYNHEANGTISGTTPQTVNYGASGTEVTATPSLGYRFVKWSDNDSTVAARTDTNVTANITATATFAIDTFTITASAGDHGTIDPTGAVSVNYGADQSFTITPAANYHVAGVLVDDVSVGTVTSYKFTSVTATHTISATFAIDTYTLTYTAGANGSITAPATSPTTHNSGDIVTITAVANATYHFVNWAGDVATVANVNAASTTITMNANYAVTANFAIDTYTVTFDKNGGGAEASPTTRTADYNTTVILPIAPIKNGYSFSSWNTLANGSGTAFTATTPVTASLTVYAQWLSGDATLKASSTVKGQVLESLGSPFGKLSIKTTAGAVTIIAAKAADTSNDTTFITLFVPTDAKATVKVVKYASGGSTAGFEMDAVYANEAITDADFFIVKVTAAYATVLYYKVVVTVTPAPSSDATITGGALEGVALAGNFTGGANIGASTELTVTVFGGETDDILGLTKGNANSVINYIVGSGTPASDAAYTVIYVTPPSTNLIDTTSNTIIWLLVTAEDATTKLYYKITATAASSDATLKASSTVKGQTVTSLGTPNATLGSETAGAVTITATQAADVTNAGSFITLFDKTDTGATVTKVVKYATSGNPTATFASDIVFDPTATITTADFFIVRVTAAYATVLYYKVVVTVTPAPSSDASIEAGTLGGMTLTDLPGEGVGNIGSSAYISVVVAAGSRALELTKGNANSVIEWVLVHRTNDVAPSPQPANDAAYTGTYTSGSTNITVAVGDAIWLLVTAEDGTKRYYWIDVTVAATPVAFSTLTANGASGTVSTTVLTLTFGVDPTTLAVGNIAVTGATKGTLTGTGTTRTLAISAITVVNGANVTVAIANPSGFAITPASLDVAVNVAATPVAFSTLTANGTSKTESTTVLTLTFGVDPTTLAVGNIAVTGATKGALAGSGLTRTLAISAITVVNGANVTVAIANPAGFAITPASKTVAVNVAATPVAFSILTANGTSGTVSTTVLTLTFDVDPTTLAVGNIAVTGATKGALAGSGLTRTLAISGITVANGADVTVAIANPSGFAITPASKTVAVNVAPLTVTVSKLTTVQSDENATVSQANQNAVTVSQTGNTVTVSGSSASLNSFTPVSQSAHQWVGLTADTGDSHITATGTSGGVAFITGSYELWFPVDLASQSTPFTFYANGTSTAITVKFTNPITTATIAIAAPVIGGTPAATIASGTGYIGAISWTSPASGNFVAGTPAATVVLTAYGLYTFTGMAATGAVTIAGSTSATYVVSGTDGKTLTITVGYAALVAAALITSSTYDVTTGNLVLTGVNFNTGAAIDVTKLTITGYGTTTLSAATANPTPASATSATVVVAGADKILVDTVLNRNGTVSSDGITYNLRAAIAWQPGAAEDATTPITVSNAAAAATIATKVIAGVTAPATGTTPTATITATTEYTATISWNGTPTTFGGGTVYTATIALTAKAGYTLTGVAANFFTVAGAAATNVINAGVVSAVFPATATLSLGNSCGGGKVAYILVNGDPGYSTTVQHGLIAATTDQSIGIIWALSSYQGISVPGGATSQAIGTGLTNTNLIVTQNGGVANTYAAGLARGYNGGDFNDWYLPSFSELEKLYSNRTLIGGFASSAYWSSSENTGPTASTNAVEYLFSLGAGANTTKGSLLYVRAVRTF